MFNTNGVPTHAGDPGVVGGVCVKLGVHVGVKSVPGTKNELTGVQGPKLGPPPEITSRARKNIVEPGQN